MSLHSILYLDDLGQILGRIPGIYISQALQDSTILKEKHSHRINKATILRCFFTLDILAIALIRSYTFTLPMAISPDRTSTIKTSSIPCAPCLGMAVCDIDSAVLVDRKTDACKIYKEHPVYSDELNNTFDMWTL